jgi:O-antigen ligase
MSLKKKIIIFFCIIEIILMSPRTFSYIIIDLLPIRIYSLPLITVTFFITITGYFATELLALNYLLKRLIKLRIAAIIWICILIISALRNPLRDVFFEGQGMIVFMTNVVMFSVSSVYLGKKRIWLIYGIFTSIAATIFVLNYVLLTNPDMLPKGYSQDDIRFEGLYSSTPIMALVAISTAFFVIFRKIIVRLFGLIGLLVSVSGLAMTATRSALGASFIACVGVILYIFKFQKRSIKTLGIVLLILPLIVSAIVGIIRISPSFGTNIDYVFDRISMLTELSYDKSRLDEAFQDIGLFIKSPLWGHGYGLLNIYSVEGWNTPFFGHNFLTSILSRTGFLGFIIIVWYSICLFKKMHLSKYSGSLDVVVISKAALLSAFFLIIISNFSGFQTFGIYGALAGIACGANIGEQYNNYQTAHKQGIFLKSAALLRII